jgi:hypothetical protein
MEIWTIQTNHVQLVLVSSSCQCGAAPERVQTHMHDGGKQQNINYGLKQSGDLPWSFQKTHKSHTQMAPWHDLYLELSEKHPVGNAFPHALAILAQSFGSFLFSLSSFFSCLMRNFTNGLEV